ncbi:MAG: hypothetical protein KDB22_28970, partial [Planctomycetales bacterium]|nr:hypothetical protein [Planctomycetales bacterium]
MLSQIPRNVGRDVANVLFFPLQAVAAEFDELESLLSREEIARADRYALDKLRRRYIIGRARLRQLLGKLTETPPAAVRISYERRGKPKLDSNEVPLVHFNVAHSADWAAIAWATSEIGIDLEIAQPGFQHASIASQVLSQTEQIQWDRI